MKEVIIVEDDLVDARVLARHIKAILPDAAVNIYTSAEEFLERGIDSCDPRTAFLFDYFIGDVTGRSLAMEVRSATTQVRDAPILLLTGAMERQIAVDAVSSGVDELLFKQDLSVESIQLAVLKAIRNWQTRRSREVHLKQLRNLGRMLAHDLRNPVSGIVAAVDLMLEDDETRNANHRLLTLIRETAEGAVGLINQRLGALRTGIEAEGDDIVDEAALADMLEEIKVLYALQLSRIGGRIMLGHMASVPVGSVMLRQVLTNLIDNAIKYRSERPLTVAIDVRRECNHVHLVLRDNGRGIAEEQRLKLFKGDHYGRMQGNGLPFVAEMVEELGGTIRCVSDGATYTQFEFVFVDAVSTVAA